METYKSQIYYIGHAALLQVGTELSRGALYLIHYSEICPLTFSAHYNFVRDGRYSEKGWGLHPHPHHPGLILRS